jgi:integrase
MASVYRRCRKCRSTSRLPDGVRVCDEHGKGAVAWTGSVETGTAKRRSRRYIGYFITRAEAEVAAADLVKKHRTGELAVKNDITVGEWLDEWLETSAKLRVRPTTLRSYTFQVNIVGRHLGDIPLQKLTLGRVQSFYAHLVDEKAHGLTATTARRYHALLHRALKVAVKRGLIDRNPLADEDAFELRVEQPEHVVWTPQELSAYLSVAMTHRLGKALYLAAMSGARRGEVVGVQWRDLDLGAGEWNVVRTELVTGPGVPKSKAGRRTIGLDPNTVQMLSQWRTEQRRELLGEGVNILGVDDLPVFNRPGTTSVINPDSLTRLHGRVVKKSGLVHMRLHGLRHLHGSFLVSAGESLKAISTRLGHSTPAFTLSVYVRDLPQERQAMATRFASILDEAANQ